MNSLKHTNTDCVTKLQNNGGKAHNHYGGYKAFNDFQYKAASFLLNETLIETVVTLFLDEQKTKPGFILGHFILNPSGDVSIRLINHSPELTNISEMIRILISALDIQISKLGKQGGRMPAGAKAYVLQKNVRFLKQITNVHEAESTGVIHPFFKDKILKYGMGMNKCGGSVLRKKKRVS